MSRPERPTRPPEWEECHPDDFAWIDQATVYMDAIEQENERLRKALKDIMQHQVFVAGPIAAESATHRIARWALEDHHE